MTRTGRYKTNAEGRDRFYAIAHRLGLNEKQMLASFAGDEETRTAAIYPEAPGTLGAVQFRVTKDGYPAFHLGGLFLKHPTLRPPFKMVDVTAAVETDANGLECLVLYMGSATQHTVTRRGSANSTANNTANTTSSETTTPENEA